MPCMPEIAKTELLPPWGRPVPLWFKIPEATRKALQKYQRRKYHTDLKPPSGPADIIEFDPAKEMKEKPHPEGSQWRK